MKPVLIYTVEAGDIAGIQFLNISPKELLLLRIQTGSITKKILMTLASQMKNIYTQTT